MTDRRQEDADLPVGDVDASGQPLRHVSETAPDDLEDTLPEDNPDDLRVQGGE